VISGLPAPGSVFVHLFEWKWTDIALECEHYLGPAGFAGVQVSPPSEHLLIRGYPWWQRYQTVSYSLANSRSGTAAEFKDMVQRCARVGVGIYADAVVNHMTGQGSGVGSNGTVFTSKYEYPGLYTATDFHQPPCTIQGSDYSNAPDRVRTCELLGLADLNTASDSVRGKIAGYLSSLVDLGVAGFRIDAAKHMYPGDIDAIVTRVNQHVASAKKPFFYQEIVDYGGEAIHSSDYLGVGVGSGQAASAIEFKYAGWFDKFLNVGGSTIGEFRGLSAQLGAFLPSAQAVVFTTNHDTERATAIFYQDGKVYDLATVFLLAFPYGYPSLMSSFAFDRTTSAGLAQGPPSDTMGHTNSIYAPGSTTPNCAPNPATAGPGTWVCQHRDAFIPGMVAFRKATAGTDVTNFWDNGANQIAFARTGKGFVVINREGGALGRTFTTGLPAGDYCDVIAGKLQAGACTGATITVDGSGMANINAAPMSAVAIFIGEKK
jgi:alpha-amylase